MSKERDPRAAYPPGTAATPGLTARSRDGGTQSDTQFLAQSIEVTLCSIKDFGGRRSAVSDRRIVLHDHEMSVTSQDVVGFFALPVGRAWSLMVRSRRFDSDVAQYRFGGGHADSFWGEVQECLPALGELGSQAVADGIGDLVDTIEDGAELIA
jgi:hypothetical protein